MATIVSRTPIYVKSQFTRLAKFYYLNPPKYPDKLDNNTNTK